MQRGSCTAQIAFKFNLRHYNSGVMLWRNTEWSRGMLEKLWAMEHLPFMRGGEQAQLIKLLQQEDPEQRRHYIFDQSVFNANPKVHHKGLFIIHMMGHSNTERVKTFSGYLALDKDEDKRTKPPRELAAPGRWAL